MHLEHVEVINFRGITELRLDLESGATVCFGENAWGKTTLVEALQSTLGARTITEADFHRLENDRSTIARRMGISLRFGASPPRGGRARDGGMPGGPSIWSSTGRGGAWGGAGRGWTGSSWAPRDGSCPSRMGMRPSWRIWW